MTLTDRRAGRHPDLVGVAPIGATPPYDAVIFDLDGVVTDTAVISRAQKVRVFTGAVDLARRLRAGGVPTGLVTAAHDAPAVLASAGIADLFPVVVDGDDAAALGLAPEPDPATLVEAARRLGAPPDRVAVVHDAPEGIAAARRGGFALAVGVDRVGRRHELEAAGADVVVHHLDQLDLGVFRADPWSLRYEGFDPAHEGHREALTTLGNGYMGTRGAAPERADDGVHYPGTYLAGVYNRLTSTVHGREVEDEHLVNAPNWLLLDVRVTDDGWWSEGSLGTVHDSRELDMRRGLLTRRATVASADGRHLEVTQRRLVSMARPHVAALETTLVARGWSGPVAVRCGVDAGVVNANVAELAALANRHLAVVDAQPVAADTFLVEAETTWSRVRIATAARTTVSPSGSATPRWEADGARHRYGHHLDLHLTDGEPVVVDKTVAICTSRDPAISSPGGGALAELARAPVGVAGLLTEHRRAWRRLWERFRIDLDSEREVQLVLHLHVFHLLQTVSPHTTLVDTGVPARGLHGEGYRGHVFWDALFVLPVIDMHLPEVTEELLDYRWRRLDAARQAARARGWAGALFPWQSGTDGREETPRQLYNPRSRRWMPDNSYRQRHVGLAIAYDTWQHLQATGDVRWFAERGAELIIEVARLFSSLARHDPGDDRYHIEGVMGPDEYHDGYPEAPGAGLRDNAYTNVLAAWVLERATETLSLLAGHDAYDLTDRLGLLPAERERWDRVRRRLAVPFHGDGVVSQFAGYEALDELDWDRYRRTYGNIGRLDLILEAEGDTTNRYKLAKQADVLMLVYLLGPDELIALLGRLGYELSPEALNRTVDYYLARTAHGSTLSRVVHASVLARLDRPGSWDIFRDALAADLDDTQGGTTREGIHLGAMAGTVDIVTRAFAGARVETDRLSLAPRLPAGLRRARFEIGYRGQRIIVKIDHDALELAARPSAHAAPVRIDAAGTSFTLAAGETRTLPLRP